MEFKVIDIHCHPSMKPYNNEENRPDVDIWKGIKAVRKYFDSVPGLIRDQIQETERNSQSNLNEFIKGNILSGFLVLHPAERGWFSRNTRPGNRILKWLLKQILPESKMKYLAASLTGFPIDKINKIFESVNSKKGIDYFTKETYKEYDYIKRYQKSTGSWGFTYEIVNNHEDYFQVLEAGKSIPVILTVEGGHSLTNVKKGEYFQIPYDSSELPGSFKENLKNDLTINIGRLKGKKSSDEDEYTFDKKHTPFFVTLSHMYNNFLAGHAKTFPGAIASLLDQVAALNEAITPAGNHAIEQLLSRKNGQRILIDVKHLSVTARSEYYLYVKEKREQTPPDHIPIVCSHAAMNGFEQNDVNRIDDKKLEKNSYFSRWSINLSNEDIREIHDSDGIIGLVIHEGRMPGKRARKKFKDLKKKIRKGGKDTHKHMAELKNAYLQLIISNLYQVVIALNSKKGWEHIGIGSDYDGIMDPFDFYKTSGTFQDLMNDVYNYLSNPTFDLIVYRNDKENVIKASEVPNYFFGYTPREIVENVGYKNVERFLGKYFTSEYLAVG